MTTRIVLLGANGQLGRTLQTMEPPAGHEMVAFGRDALDIADDDAVRRHLDDIQPQVLINAAAYTAVDAAESDVDAARDANATGPRHLGRWARENDAHLVHLSTDFVFNGRSWRPYVPEDQPDPLGFYGRSKLEGEMHLRYLAPEHSVILRTGWVYSAHGRNFLRTMLRLMAEKEQLQVVDDQIGTPTSTESLAQCVLALAQRRPTGIYHWSDAGVASWYDFAVAIQEEALQQGLLERAIPIAPIPTRDYPTPAHRPLYTVLDKTATIDEFGLRPPHWRQALRRVLQGM